MPTVLRGVLVSFLVVAGAFPAPGVASFDESFDVAPEGQVSASDYDAANYADYFHVSLAEARGRLELQALAGTLDGKLASQSPKTYAGMWITNAPEFTVTVAFTTIGEAELAGLVDERIAKYLRTRQVSCPLVGLLESMKGYASSTAQPIEAAIEVSRNQVVILTTDAASLANAFAGRLASDGDRVAVREVSGLSTPAANVYGGLSITSCTSGFGIIRAGTGERGIVTAGHCPNTQAYGGVTMAFRDEATTGSYDEQWNARGTLTVKNWFRYNAAGNTREVTSRKNWVDMVQGATVCKYGRTTGYTCGEIQTKFYQPSACISGATATYVYVHRNGVGMFDAGDSGGPVFLNNTAYGIGNCRVTYQEGPPKLQDEIFMAENYIEYGLNITVMTAP